MSKVVCRICKVECRANFEHCPNMTLVRQLLPAEAKDAVWLECSVEVKSLCGDGEGVSVCLKCIKDGLFNLLEGYGQEITPEQLDLTMGEFTGEQWQVVGEIFKVFPKPEIIYRRLDLSNAAIVVKVDGLTFNIDYDYDEGLGWVFRVEESNVTGVRSGWAPSPLKDMVKDLLDQGVSEHSEAVSTLKAVRDKID